MNTSSSSRNQHPSTASSQERPRPPYTPTRSLTGLNIRTRTLKALDSGVNALGLNDENDKANSTSSSSSQHSNASGTASSATKIGSQLRKKSASFVSLASLPLHSAAEGTNSSRSSARSLLTDVKGRSRQSSYSSTFNLSLTEEQREVQYKKHNLVPLPPPGYTRPVLLPTYAVNTPEGGFTIRLDGFVEVWPRSVGTSQRVFNQMVRQMANLPRLPRQQPTPASAASVPWSSATSASMPSSPLHEDTDDSVFFPDVPYGIPRSAKTDETRKHDGVGELGITERITQQAFALGAPEKAIEKMMQTVGALPVETKLDSDWEAKVEKEAEQEVKEEAKLHEAQSSQPGRQGPLGGSSYWSDRSKEEVERLWHTLEHRLRSFWTYRKPHQQVMVEVIPVFQGDESEWDQDWTLDEYETSSGRDPSNLAPLIAMTKLVSDSSGLFTSELTITKEKAMHYLSHYHGSAQKDLSTLLYLRIRACMLIGSNQMVRSQWQSLRVTLDEPTSVRVICDIDDTTKHTDILAGSRMVTRNVFVRPFEEVRVAGVTHWFDSLCHEAKVDGFHFVTNAPAEMYGIVKAYLSSAQLPLGHLALKHYFSPTKTASWLQTFLQPASSRKRQNLLRCLDDFPQSKFIFIGDSGEMDLEIYSELAKERPKQVRGIWIRDVGNVTSTAKSMANGSFAETIPSFIQAPPTAHLSGQGHASNGNSSPQLSSKDAATPTTTTGTKTTAMRRSAEVLRKASLNTSTPINEYEARLTRALALLPPTTILRFWSTGQDATQESISYIQELKSGTK